MTLNLILSYCLNLTISHHNYDRGESILSC
uniref:Uncharacterized protein n=1 Tax=Rhizophora mucronata TaxID=61149 RepID=A0A2P2LFF9_RHIMU